MFSHPVCVEKRNHRTKQAISNYISGFWCERQNGTLEENPLRGT